MYVLYVTKCNLFYSLFFILAYAAPYAAIFTASVKYGGNTKKESAVITGHIMFNRIEQL